MPIPVIDLFAGPGGLGEGFSSLRRDGEPAFKIKLSIEMDQHAHQTLQLRAFFRQFPDGKTPEEYYDHLAGRLTCSELFAKFPEEKNKAEIESWHAELGSKDIPAEDVEARICLALGNRANWVLIGGPPCQAYSIAGRSRVIGGEGIEKYESDPRHNLYRHYIRILAILQPPVFVMENVKGLLSARPKKEHIFQRILDDLTNPLGAKRWAGSGSPQDALTYRLTPLKPGSHDILAGIATAEPEDFIIRAEDFGIPQARHRIIILGIRSDLAVKARPLRKSQTIALEEVIGDLPKLRSGLSQEPDSAEGWQNSIRQMSEAAWLKNGSITDEVRQALLRACLRVGKNLDKGGPFLEGITIAARHSTWFFDKRLKGVCNHESRTHIRQDLHRYLFAAVFAKQFGRSPLLEDFPRALLPEHKNVEDALKETKFNDRFRVQMAGRPATTIVSHISKDGNYYIHYDAAQCRSLTVREAARVQTFPDNYFFEGPRTEQYHQVGNAVPPLLAHQIAEIVAELFD